MAKRGDKTKTTFSLNVHFKTYITSRDEWQKHLGLTYRITVHTVHSAD